MIFILNMIRSNMNSTPPELGNRQKRHSKVHYTIYHITGDFFNPTAQSMDYGRMPLLPWSCAMVQKENQTQLHEFWTLTNWKYSGFLSVAPRTDPPFSDGVTERPTSDCTQHRLSVCKWTLTWPTDLSFFCIYNLCLRGSCLFLPELSPAAGMSCVHPSLSPYNHKVFY